MVTNDAAAHTHRSAEVYRAFEQGVYWPRWFPLVYNGLGAPTFHHYSPGLYWLVAAIHQAGIGLDQALKLVLTGVFALSGLSGYAWLRHAFSPPASMTGVALYLFYPYVWTRSLYFVGDHPQLMGLLLLPVCLWAFTALHMRGRLRNWIAASVSLTALVYCHNMTAMFGAAVLLINWLLLAVGYRRRDGLLRCALAALLAALLSAGFWLPALADLSHVQIENGRTGFFHFSNHFLDWRRLFSYRSPLLDSRDGNPLRSPVTFGAATWLALAAGLISVRFVTQRELRYWGLAGGLFALAMLTLTLPLARPLWETIPLLIFVQFPFRFLGIAHLGALPAAALAVDAWPANRRWLPSLTLLIAAFLALFAYLFPARTLLLRPVQVISTLTAGETRSIEQQSGLWGMTTSNEFLARGADLDIVSGRTPEPSAIQLTWRSPHEAIADLAGQTESVLLRLHYHPGWSAGGQATLTPGPVGWMQVTELRNPEQPLVIRWEGTAAQRWGERLSLVGLVASLTGLLFLTLRRRKEGGWSGERERPARPVSYQVKTIVGCVLVLLVVRYGLDRSSGGPYWWHSPPELLGFSVEGQPVTLGDASSTRVTLLGWKLLSRESPLPGGTVNVRLFWQGQGRINEELRTFLHLYTPALQRSWAVKNRGVGRPGTQFWQSGNYYVDDMLLYLPADLPPVSYSLVAGLVASDGDRLTVPGTTDNLLYLRTLDVAPTRAGFLQGERPSTATRAATDDGLRLQGYDLLSDAGRPTLRLFWETGAGVANDWITYIHLYDSLGERIAQFDGPALAGLQPTSHWHTNALYIDRRQLDLPDKLEPGAYLFRIGLYDRASGERLSFQPDDNTQGAFENGQLLIPLTVAPANGAPD